jgi:adenylate cyclase
VVDGMDRVPAPSPGERAVLEHIAAAPLVRLACQLRPLADLSVVPLLPADWSVDALRRRQWPLPGEERFIVVMMVDMRDSTRLAETRLPFDAVFVVDCFITVAGAAVQASGGRVSHFLGDGLMATFGLACGAGEACRQALAALVAIGRNIETLNQVLTAEIGEAVRFGIGMHCGSAVIGEIGHGEARIFTTLGDVANVAARLEGLCKSFGCEAVISHDVCAMAGVPSGDLSEQEVVVRGRSAPLLVHPIEQAVQIAHLVSPPVAPITASHHGSARRRGAGVA